MKNVRFYNFIGADPLYEISPKVTFSQICQRTAVDTGLKINLQ